MNLWKEFYKNEWLEVYCKCVQCKYYRRKRRHLKKQARRRNRRKFKHYDKIDS